MRRVILLLLCLAGLFAAPISALAVADIDTADYTDEHPTQKWAFVVGNSNYAEQEVIPSSSVDAVNVKLTPLWSVKLTPLPMLAKPARAFVVPLVPV